MNKTRSHLAKWLLLLLPLITIIIVMYKNYLEYGYKSHYHEATSILSDVYNRQVQYKQGNNKYASNLDIIGVTNQSHNYSLTFNNNYYEPEIGYGRARILPLKYNTCFGDTYYNAFAISNLDGDTFVDIWMIESDGNIFQIQSDYKDKILTLPPKCLSNKLEKRKEQG